MSRSPIAMPDMQHTLLARFPEARQLSNNEWLVRCHRRKNHHRGDLNPSMTIDLEQRVWYCHTEKVGGKLSEILGADSYPRAPPSAKPIRARPMESLSVHELTTKQRGALLAEGRHFPEALRMLNAMCVHLGDRSGIGLGTLKGSYSVLGVSHDGTVRRNDAGKIEKRHWPPGSGSSLIISPELFTGNYPEIIFLAGEWDLLAALEYGILNVATGTAGEGSVKPFIEHLEFLAGFEEITILYDRDSAGAEGARRLVAALHKALPSDGQERKFRIVDLPEEVGPGGDVRDYLQKCGHEGEDLAMLIDRTSYWRPDEVDSSDSREGGKRELPTASPWLELVDRSLPIEQGPVAGGLVPRRSMCFLGGPPKLGKSLLALNLGLSVAAGVPFLGRFATVRSRVLLIEAEVGLAGLQRRLRAMKAGHSADLTGSNFLVVSKGDLGRRPPKIDDPEGFAVFRGLLEHHKPDLVIIDPLSRFHSMTDENSAGAMLGVLEQFDALVTEFGCSILVVHHHRKPGREEGDIGAQALRGSSAIFGFGDSYLSHTRVDYRGEGKRARLSFELRQDEEPDPINLALNPESLWWEPLEEFAGRHAVGVVQVGETLRGMGGSASRPDLIRALIVARGVSKRTVVDAMERARAEGVIHRLPKKGRTHWYTIDPPAQGNLE